MSNDVRKSDYAVCELRILAHMSEFGVDSDSAVGSGMSAPIKPREAARTGRWTSIQPNHSQVPQEIKRER